MLLLVCAVDADETIGLVLKVDGCVEAILLFVGSPRAGDEAVEKFPRDLLFVHLMDMDDRNWLGKHEPG